ncbi:MAG TPA: TlpA disulfide reductase family protein [Thermoanaerobaculia bacterium]|nr:TlpA disulfide reductase family protein [Thermoanaerobaculia bacterium]HUM29036.1 TlpA disulfide reductase family protein [Thermoanaerobaculia bacterium]HXK67408.1 TlpA disulfide reductase family protein [Thermoanaerobaculia bacterium]
MRHRILLITLSIFLVFSSLCASSNLNGMRLINLDGTKTYRLEDLQGTITIVNFWATWCPPCRVELPVLMKVAERYRDRGVRLITISLDAKSSVVTKFLKKKDLEALPAYRLMEGSSSAGVESLPTTFVQDSKGSLIMTFSGYDSTMEDQLVYLIERHLESKKTTV